MTAQVIAGIHWQALRLWAKRNPVYTHPSAGGASMIDEQKTLLALLTGAGRSPARWIVRCVRG